ncbi:MAG TPA: hypothetical protein VEQ58_13505 [Polyangiaceae bacterium]|nr:hypothetical protein [Polyangiaceae bacterium]
MKSFSFGKALTLAGLLCLSLPVACGDDDDDTSPGNTAGSAGSSSGSAGKSASGGGGTGGKPTTPSEGGTGGGGAELPPGLSNDPSTTTCGADKCSSVKAVNVYVDPCCTSSDGCGLQTGFLDLVGAHFDEACQPLAQPGELDATCPDATGLMVPSGTTSFALDPLPGCCREDGMCGVVVDRATIGGGGISIATLGLGCVDGKPFFNGEARQCGAGGGSGGADSGGASSVAGASGNVDETAGASLGGAGNR